MLRTAIVVALLAGCGLDEQLDDGLDGDVDVVLEDPDPEGKADGVTLLWYTQVPGEVFLPSAKLRTETRMLFKSEAEWQAHFGQPSPGIDFANRWAIFYTPGTENPRLAGEVGWRAYLSRVSLSSNGRTVSITTRLETNGDCAWRSARPFYIATIAKPATAPPYRRFYTSDRTRACN